MKCYYSKDDFVNECERLMKIQDSKTGKTTVYTTEENDLPCVYAMLYDEGFEYALLDEEQSTIYYIYLQGIDRRDLYFDEKLLPKDYGQKGLYYETERYAYRIYEKID